MTTAIDQIEDARRRRQELEKQLEKSRAELALAEQELKQAEEDVRRWQDDWTQAVQKLGLTGTESPSEAGTAVQLADELSSKVKEINDLQRRVDGIDRDHNEFDGAVKRLLADLQIDLDSPVVQCASGKTQIRTTGYNCSSGPDALSALAETAHEATASL